MHNLHIGIGIFFQTNIPVLSGPNLSSFLAGILRSLFPLRRDKVALQ